MGRRGFAVQSMRTEKRHGSSAVRPVGTSLVSVDAFSQSASALTPFAVGDGSFGIAIRSPIAGCLVLPFQNSTSNLKFGFAQRSNVIMNAASTSRAIRTAILSGETSVTQCVFFCGPRSVSHTSEERFSWRWNQHRERAAVCTACIQH